VPLALRVVAPWQEFEGLLSEQLKSNLETEIATPTHTHNFSPRPPPTTLRMLEGKTSGRQIIILSAEKMSTQICAAVAFKNNVNRSEGAAAPKGEALDWVFTARLKSSRPGDIGGRPPASASIQSKSWTGPRLSSSRRLSLLYPESLKLFSMFLFQILALYCFVLLNGSDHHQQGASALGYPG